MEKMILYHGTDHIIKIPEYKLGKEYNDYGRGFYCTKELEVAKEWACKQNKDGFVNCYEWTADSLQTLNLLDSQYSILNWLALLLEHRTFQLGNQITVDARAYLIRKFAIDVTQYDAVIGYRADDSYFSFAEAFLANSLPLRSLNRALRLGKLGEQTVLTSERAFQHIRFLDVVAVDRTQYYPQFIARDLEARVMYREVIKNGHSYRDDIFMLDILREEMENNDPRLQRILSV